jgi:hypothetical protein
MGRRDQPKLDELQRLLRRLEHMEVDKGSEPSRKAAADSASKSSGYVGALRGAPTVDDPGESAGYDPFEPQVEFDSGSSGRQRSSSTASIVIGATTAAVVSSLVVVGLLLYTQGNDGKSSDDQRLNFVVPTQKNEGPALGRTPGGGSSSPGEAQTLLQRADVHIRSGRLSEARESLEQAAKLGSGVAALTLGAMYDPNRVAEFGNLGVQADPTLARAWYERAKDLGVVEADNRLSELARK